MRHCSGGEDGQRTKTTSPMLGALDLGTNNCRLLVARPNLSGRLSPDDQMFHVTDAFSRIVRLGEGVNRTGQLSDAAMGRTLEALSICQAKIRRGGVTHLRAVATEACRKALNGAAFLDRVLKETGIQLEIIAHQEEARLAMNGCSALLTPDLPYALMFDIGGGSTELMWMHVTDHGGRVAADLIDQISLPHGVVGMAECFGGDRIRETTYHGMVDMIREGLVPFEKKNNIRYHIRGGRVQMVGCSGTVTTLAGIHQNLSCYRRDAVDGTYMETRVMRDVISRLQVMDYNERAAIPCIGPDRADLVVAGCAVLQAICEHWPVDRFRIGDRGVREGILVDLYQSVIGKSATGKKADVVTGEKTG
jgi:exopolyphosphatase / guanosine-5'-triphosphate,3'-diphosphate pyrophosphatase